MLSLIVALDDNRGIGNNNQLLCHLPADLNYFKEKTMGKPIIMGRRTHLSIGKALPGRLNIVLSQQGLTYDNVTMAKSLEQALALADDAPEVMIIGGAQLFAQALPFAQRIYMTRIHAKCQADVFFPELDEHVWPCVEAINRPKDEKNRYDLTFSIYERA